jgi:RimJ/RimL family protein N-acetyltransferase
MKQCHEKNADLLEHFIANYGWPFPAELWHGLLVEALGNMQTITFKKLTTEDLPLVLSWFNEPHVMEWWPYPEPEEKFFEHFLERCRSKDTFAYIAIMDGIPFGYIQYYYWKCDDEKTGGMWVPVKLPKTTVGIDQFIGDPAYLGKGYGSLMLKEFINHISLVLEPDVTAIILDPKPTNIVAIKCYEKAGFKTLGIVDAPWGQALFMKYDVKNFKKDL